ncbi:MAG: hypothetical protein ACLP8S_26995 [Solirubrobacteraceae bacterium]
MSPISEAIVKPVIQPIPQIVDQLQAGLDVTAPRLGDLELGQQPPAGDPEQVRHRALVPERGQR